MLSVSTLSPLKPTFKFFSLTSEIANNRHSLSAKNLNFLPVLIAFTSQKNNGILVIHCCVNKRQNFPANFDI